MTLGTFVAPLAEIGLARVGLENALVSCVVENSSTSTWWLLAQALVLLVLPKKINNVTRFVCPDQVEYLNI